MRKRRCLSFLLYLLLLYFIAFSQIYAETQYFYDNFNGDTFGDWTRISGDWYLVDNQMLAISEQRQVLVINEDVGADAEITVDIEIESSYANTPEGQICFRFIDQNNFYFAGLGAYGYKVGIGKIVNGYAQELTGVGSRSEVMLKHLYHLKVIVAGDQIEVYLDSSLMCSITDADLTSGGFGLTPFKSKVWYDNFVVKNMSSSTVFSDDFNKDFLEGWGEADGYFFLENNVLRTLPEAKRSYIVADQALPDDYEVEVRVKIRESSV